MFSKKYTSQRDRCFPEDTGHIYDVGAPEFIFLALFVVYFTNSRTQELYYSIFLTPVSCTMLQKNCYYFYIYRN
jgi:hypothetical protein